MYVMQMFDATSVEVQDFKPDNKITWLFNRHGILQLITVISIKCSISTPLEQFMDKALDLHSIGVLHN